MKRTHEDTWKRVQKDELAWGHRGKKWNAGGLGSIVCVNGRKGRVAAATEEGHKSALRKAAQGIFRGGEHNKD